MTTVGTARTRQITCDTDASGAAGLGCYHHHHSQRTCARQRYRIKTVSGPVNNRSGHRDRKTQRHTHRHTETYRHRGTQTHRDTEAHRQTDRQTDTHTHTHTHTQGGRARPNCPFKSFPSLAKFPQSSVTTKCSKRIQQLVELILLIFTVV